LEQKFFIAQKTDAEIFKKYDQTESFMQIFSQDDNAIISMIPKSTDTNFLNANRDRIQEVVKLDGQLNSSVDPDKIRLYMKGSYEKFMQGDFISSFININNKSAKVEEEFPKLYGPLRKELDGVNKQVTFPKIF
jgi:glutaredoxin-related protein